IASDFSTVERGGLLVIEFATNADRAALQAYLQDFIRSLAGTDGEPHPDFPHPFFLLGDEDPAPHIRAQAVPRRTYRALEKGAENLGDELRQIPDVARTGRVATVPETIYLDYSSAKLAALQISRQQVSSAVSARNAVIPGGTFRTEGLNLPVQVTGE